MYPCEKLYYVAKCMKNSKDTFTSRETYLDICRNQLDHFVFDYLKEAYGDDLDAFWNTYTVPKISDKAIILVERRCHPNLEFCLKNAVYFARGYSVHIFCSESNIDFIKHICGSQENNIHFHIQFKGIGTREEGKYEYNTLLKQKNFWESFTEEHLLIFETDCYLIKPIPESIYKYDYVASKWSWYLDKPGGGGLSYRKRSAMLKICDAFKDDISCEGHLQDTFASEGVELLKLKTTATDDLQVYFNESMFIQDNTVGLHQWWTYITDDAIPLELYIIKKYVTLEIEEV